MFIVDENGDITIRQGDTGRISVVGINTDKNYTLYFAIQDERRRPIGDEISVRLNKQPVATIVLNAEYTDLLVVPKNDDYAIYYYGIKLCDENGVEDTSIIGNSGIEGLNTITVLPKKVEGLV